MFRLHVDFLWNSRVYDLDTGLGGGTDHSNESGEFGVEQEGWTEWYGITSITIAGGIHFSMFADANWNLPRNWIVWNEWGWGAEVWRDFNTCFDVFVSEHFGVADRRKCRSDEDLGISPLDNVLRLIEECKRTRDLWRTSRIIYEQKVPVIWCMDIFMVKIPEWWIRRDINELIDRIYRAHFRMKEVKVATYWQGVKSTSDGVLLLHPSWCDVIACQIVPITSATTFHTPFDV